MICIFITGMQLANAQVRSISGTVNSAEDGTSIPGVSVMVKGTTVGTVTNFDGKFNLSIPNDAKVLVFSFVGMKNLEVEIGNQTDFSVTMESDLISVDEVVVVGYGIQKKREVTGAISQVKGDDLANLATPSFESQLAGRSAGVQVTATNGVLGEAPRIRIRGIGSISSGTYPLIVVDGMPVFTGEATPT